MPGPGQPLGGAAGASSADEQGTPDAASGDGPIGPAPQEDPAPRQQSTTPEESQVPAADEVAAAVQAAADNPAPTGDAADGRGSAPPGDPAAPHDRQIPSRESSEPPGDHEPAADAAEDKQPVNSAMAEPTVDQPLAALDQPMEHVAVPQPDPGQPSSGGEPPAAGGGEPPEPEAEAAAEAQAEASVTEAPAESVAEPATAAEAEPAAAGDAESAAEPKAQAPAESAAEAEDGGGSGRPAGVDSATVGVQRPESDIDGPTVVIDWSRVRIGAKPAAEPEAAPPAESVAEAPAAAKAEPVAELEAEPVEPEAEAPVEPEVEAPVEPEVEAPVELEVEAPVELEAEAPVELEAEAPTEPEPALPAEPAAEAEDEAGPPAGAAAPTTIVELPKPDRDPTVVIDWSRVRIGAKPAAEPEAATPAESVAEAPAAAKAEPVAEPEAEAPVELEAEAPTEPEPALPAEPAAEAEDEAGPPAGAAAPTTIVELPKPDRDPTVVIDWSRVRIGAKPAAEPEAAPPAEPVAEPEAEAPVEPEAEAPTEPEPALPAEPAAEAEDEAGPPAGAAAPTTIVELPKPDRDPTVVIDWSRIRTGAPPPGVRDQPTVPIRRPRVAPPRPRPSAPPPGPVAPRQPARAPRPGTAPVHGQPPFAWPAQATRPQPTDQRAPAQQRVAEQRRGPERAEVAPQTRPPVEKVRPRPRRRRTVLLLVGALLVCVSLGAGVAFRRPILAAAGFGNPAPVTTTQPPPPPTDPTPALRPVRGDAPAPTQGGVTAALTGQANSSLLGTVSGSVLDAATGTVLWDHSAAQPLLPASTAKLLTSAAALLTLDHQARLSTTVLRGTEPGSVVLVGGGDPTLSALPAGKESVYPGAPRLDDLVAQVKANAGQVRKVYYDVSRYTADGLAPGWDRGDVSGGNIAPIVPLMLDGARDKPAELDPARNSAPAHAAAVEFAKRLGLGASAVAVGTAPQGAAVLGKVESAPIEELVNNLLQISDNVLAEVIGREVARAAGAEPSFAGVTRTVLDVLAHNGFSAADVQMSDGSGLSTNDRVPTRLLSAVLAVAASPNNADPRVAKLRSLLGGLPVAGGTGTLTSRYRDLSAGAGKGWVRAKTGTLTGANGLAGVVLDTEGRLLVFAFISNSAAPPDTVRPALDTMAATLRGCGCH